MTNTCDRCARPLVDQAYVCGPCSVPIVDLLLDVPGLVDELPAAMWRQTRYGSGGIGGWQEPWDQRAQDAHDAVTNALVTVARDIAETRGLAGPEPLPVMVGPGCRTALVIDRGCRHTSCATIRDRRPEPSASTAARWLAGQVDWIRHRADGLATLDELRAAVGQLRRVVDRPPDREVVGRCLCGEYLYAVVGRPLVTCRSCGESYDVATARAALRRSVDQMLLTAAEIATIAAQVGVTANREGARKLINVWAGRRVITARGDYCGQPTYRTGEVLERLSASRSRVATGAA